MDETLAWTSLSLVSGLGVRSFWRLVDHFGSPGKVITASKESLGTIKGVRPQVVAALNDRDSILRKGQLELDRLVANRGQPLFYFEDDYPLLLKQLVDPPPVVYYYGNKDLLKRPCIAMVGSRAASDYGKRTAYSFAKKLSDYGVTVVSGLAYGVDAESHAGALAGRGSTVAVLGCGLDVVYPRENKALYELIAKEGLILSEYPLGARPDSFRFPARNRIIAGLSSGVVVVEAAKKSGSLITAQIGLDYNREIFGVPGQVDSFKSEGTHWLLQQGAKLTARVEDILEEIDFYKGDGLGSEEDSVSNEVNGLDSDSRAVLQEVDVYPQMRGELMEKVPFTPARLSEILLLLELEGLIEMLPGDRVRKIEQ